MTQPRTESSVLRDQDGELQAAALAPTFDTENALTTASLGTVGGNDVNHDFKIEYNEVWNFTV